MSGKTIWIVNQDASFLETRSLSMSKVFAVSGYSPVIITASFHHGSKQYLYNARAMGMEIELCRMRRVACEGGALIGVEPLLEGEILLVYLCRGEFQFVGGIDRRTVLYSDEFFEVLHVQLSVPLSLVIVED